MHPDLQQHSIAAFSGDIREVKDLANFAAVLMGEVMRDLGKLSVQANCQNKGGSSSCVALESDHSEAGRALETGASTLARSRGRRKGGDKINTIRSYGF